MGRVSIWAAVLAVVIVSCTNETSFTTTTTEATTTTTGGASPPPSGTFNINGHDLYLSCLGAGEPTFVLDHGEGQGLGGLGVLADALASRGTVCSYDRANVGQSGPAPTPRTAEDLASDLEALLSAAGVDGPYLLVGHSAGGMFVQMYARTHPEGLIGVVAMNPVPPFGPWSEQGFAVMTPEEQAGERAYYGGQNGESLDYETSSSQIAESPSPPDIPFVILISGLAQCGSPDDICGRTTPVVTTIMQDLAGSWPDGTVIGIDAGHEIFLDDLDGVLEVIDSILASS